MSDEVELRRAELSDTDAVRCLTRQAYAKWVPLIGREPKPMQADHELAVREHRIDLLYSDGVLAGLVETIDQGDRLLVENVAVQPSFQGRELGRRLMAHAEDVARALGHRRVWLYTNKRFEENVRLYRSLGYAVEREEGLGGGTVRVDMAKSPGAESTPASRHLPSSSREFSRGLRR